VLCWRDAAKRAEPNSLSRRKSRCACAGGLMEDDFFRAAVGYNIGERMIELKRDYWPVASWRITKTPIRSDGWRGAAGAKSR
jgi:hypothetical protein